MKTILVVDDERDLLSAVCGVLKDEGYDVLEATDGKQALEVLTRQRPDLALVDVMMPFVSGVELVASVKEMPKLDGMPIVLMSAVDDPSVKRSVAGFLKKPFPIKKLLATVDQILSRASK